MENLIKGDAEQEEEEEEDDNCAGQEDNSNEFADAMQDGGEGSSKFIHCIIIVVMLTGFVVV